METQTKFNIGIILALVASFSIVGLTNLEPTHYCESRQIKAYCHSLSPTEKTCYTLPNNTGGRRCTEGWQIIPFMPEEVPEKENVIKSKHNGKVSICNQENCIKGD